ncbi:PREDICTED: subtilisin-like protease SBT3.17 [Nicotiana attenuata]|uniref:subtilisin-like protease SBT3.17 n=1 Tax=Nicotiana attenuata TaxID=49451 RepID=UPI000905B070|nr:PREDICTED: subtilisin-like protease SBT3.17 [Nicotiana attenuata]
MQKDQILSSILLLFLLIAAIVTMADSQPSIEAKVHIVYTEKPEDLEAEDYHIKTLTSVLGSEEAAKEALIYSYKHAASGFSAKLTAEQVSELSKQPGVLQVVPSQTVQLHTGRV